MDYLREHFGATGAAWIEGGGILLLAILAGAVVGTLVHRLLAAGARRSAATWDDALIPELRWPLKVVPAVVAGWLALPVLPLLPHAAHLVSAGLNVVTTLVVIWLAWRFIDVARATLATRPWAAERPATLSLVSMGARLSKLLVVIFAAITALAALGVPVASLVAGLGIGGLAVALAAQKTLANLFGAISIGVDRPFREGDYVKVGDIEGTVEAIGLRSTRIRTLARTVVAIPNGDLADTRTESFALRDRFQFMTTIGVEYGTREATLRGIVEALRAMLQGHPQVWPERVRIHFAGFAASSLDLRIQAWFLVADFDEFLAMRQDVLFKIMEIVEGAGADFAFPTQTIHLAGASAATAASTSATAG
ncbi:MAG: mechanosensitive ion channel family protein [Kofleriaceae bacterium]